MRNFRERAATSKNYLKNEQEGILSGLKIRGEYMSFFLRIYMRVCKKMAIYLRIKTHKAGKNASIRGK